MGKGNLVKHRRPDLKFKDETEAMPKLSVKKERQVEVNAKGNTPLPRNTKPYNSKSPAFGRGKHMMNQWEKDALNSAYTQLRSVAQADHDIIKSQSRVPEEKGRRNKRWYQWQEIADEMDSSHRKYTDFWFPKLGDFRDWYLITFSPGRHKTFDGDMEGNSPFVVAQRANNGLPIPYSTLFTKFFSGYKTPPVPINLMTDVGRQRYTLQVRDYVVLRTGEIVEGSMKPPKRAANKPKSTIHVYRPKNSDFLQSSHGEITEGDDVEVLPVGYIRVFFDVELCDVLHILNRTLLMNRISLPLGYPIMIISFGDFCLFWEEADWWVTPDVNDSVGVIYNNDVEYYLFIPPTFPVYHSRQYRFSQLNGNNGSWTNTDDVEYEYRGHCFKIVDNKRCVLAEFVPDALPLPSAVDVVPAFSAFGRFFDSRKVTICPMLYTLISSNLRVLPDEPRNLTVVINFVRQAMGIFTPDVQIDHLTLYAFRNKGVSHTSDVVGQSRLLFETISSNGLIVLPMSESLQINYRYNRRWKIVKSSGFQFLKVVQENGQFVVSRYPSFKTAEPLIQIKNGCKHAYALFHPSAGFSYYAKNGKNAIQALSRYLKQRTVDDDDADQRQLSLIDCTEPALLTKLCEACEATFDPILNTIQFRSVSTGERDRPVRQRTVNIPTYQRSAKFLDVLLYHVHQYYISNWFERMWAKVIKTFSQVWEDTLSWLNNSWFWLKDQFTWLHTYALLPHPKRELRIQYVERNFDDIMGVTGSFESKIKWEAAKFGKAPRLYASLGATSMAAILPVDLIKFFTTTEFTIGTYIGEHGDRHTFKASYCEANSKSASDEVYLRASRVAEGDYHMFFFSDDGFLVTRENGSLRKYETDISSCDASNGFAINYLLYWLACQFGVGEEFYPALQISAKNTILRNPDAPSEYVVLRPESFFEYSGERTTTVKNNLASLAIAYGIFIEVAGGVDTREAITLGASRFGWVVTVSLRETFNTTTFLKRAYNGQHSWLVYGPILRSLCLVDGKPEARHFGLTHQEFKTKTPEQLLEILLTMAYESLLNEPNSPLKAAICDRLHGCSYLPYEVTEDDVCERYHMETWELAELLGYVRSVRYGESIVCVGLDKIYKVDYDVDYVHQPPDLNVPHNVDIDSFW